MDIGRDALVLQVEGMVCAGCERRVVNVLRRMDGVRDASADHVSGHVQVDLTGPSVEPGVLAERIARAGYQVTGTRSVAEAARPGAEAASGRDSQ